MRVTPFDWVIVVASIVVSFLPAVFLARRAGRSTAEFFTSGRSAPWWLIGVSMVATTFSTDTPNLVTNMVREKGVADNWLWLSLHHALPAPPPCAAPQCRPAGLRTHLAFHRSRSSG